MALLAKWAGVPAGRRHERRLPGLPARRAPPPAGARRRPRHRRRPRGAGACAPSWRRRATRPPATTASPCVHPPTPRGPGRGYVVVHPTASVPARAHRRRARGRARSGAVDRRVAGRRHRRPGRRAAPGWPSTPPGGVDLTGRDLPGRAGRRPRRRRARSSSATPARPTSPPRSAPRSVSSSLRSCPLERWRPWGVPTVVLGDQAAACRAQPGPDLPGGRPPVHRRGSPAGRSSMRCAPSPGATSAAAARGSRAGAAR